MKKLIVNLKNYSYPVFYKKNLLKENFIIDFCKKIGFSIVIVTHKNIQDLFAKSLYEKFKKENFKVKILSFEQGEENKTRRTKEYLEDELIKNNFGKDTLVVAIGGGIVSDVAGFLASTYMRGIPYIIVPTTLLAMVDASIGGKTAVNTNLAKNLIGTIYQPKAVFLDFEVLKTLDDREIKNGLIEMLKHTLISSKKAFYDLLNAKRITQKLIIESIRIKKQIIEKDEKEESLRKILNFGHTISHAIEGSLNFKISHGEALVYGIYVESYLSYAMNYLSKKHFEEIVGFLKNKGLFQNKYKFSIDRIINFLKNDKKNILGKNQFILLKNFGKPINNVGIIKNLIVNSLSSCLEDMYVNNCNNRT
jgi:3-dehydroquinate synthase